MLNIIKETNEKAQLKKLSNVNYYLPSKSTKWKEKDLEYFRVKFDKLEFPLYSKDEFPYIYKKLFLVGWGKERISNEDLIQLDDNTRWIVQRLRNILQIKPKIELNAEINSFIHLLLNELGFNDHPYVLYDHYKYSTHVKKQPFKSSIDFLILKDDKVFIIQHNSTLDSNVTNNQGESHIIGEIIMSALHIVNVNQEANPLVVNFINVIGTCFTFYKAEFPLGYISSAYHERPEKSLTIRRYPQKDEFKEEIPALNFCIEKDRYLIFNGIYSIFN